VGLDWSVGTDKLVLGVALDVPDGRGEFLLPFDDCPILDDFNDRLNGFKRESQGILSQRHLISPQEGKVFD
jgi:hypothetical protein